jgi:hypothetical protein
LVEEQIAAIETFEADQKTGYPKGGTGQPSAATAWRCGNNAKCMSDNW